MLAMRNIVAHDYRRVRLTIIWETVAGDLPPLANMLHDILEPEP
jgi:uncharacterized protein with HEPN domain